VVPAALEIPKQGLVAVPLACVEGLAAGAVKTAAGGSLPDAVEDRARGGPRSGGRRGLRGSRCSLSSPPVEQVCAININRVWAASRMLGRGATYANRDRAQSWPLTRDVGLHAAPELVLVARPHHDRVLPRRAGQHLKRLLAEGPVLGALPETQERDVVAHGAAVDPPRSVIQDGGRGRTRPLLSSPACRRRRRRCPRRAAPARGRGRRPERACSARCRLSG
jgi:hypothetical protein